MSSPESRHKLPKPGAFDSTSHGPPDGSPVFYTNGGRILDVTEFNLFQGGRTEHFVRLLIEGLDEPTDATTEIMPYRDYLDLLRSQPTSKSAYE